MEQVMGVEPTSSAWKADVLAVVRHLHASDNMYYSIAFAAMQVFLFDFFKSFAPLAYFYKTRIKIIYISSIFS